MIEINNITTTVNREIGKIFTSYEQPTAILLGGIHGNEQSGIEAIQTVFQEIQQKNIPLKGNLIGLRGNLKAVQANERYIDEDLNRMWTKSRLNDIQREIDKSSEADEVRELRQELDTVIRQSKADVFMMDLHTTSSFSSPFAIIDDTLRNRKIASALPVTRVLGIMEKLDGTILGYYGDKGPITLVFEAGQHFEKESIQRHTAALWLSLVQFGILDKEAIPYDEYYKFLFQSSAQAPQLVETIERFALRPTDYFQMKPGFTNFSKVEKGDLLAEYNGDEIHANQNCYVFMPLYQNKGQDGFFLVKPVSLFWLAISKWLRKMKADRYLTLLPGIKKHPKNENAFLVNTAIAWFKTIEILHLLGFRKVKKADQTLIISRLPYDLKGPWG